MPARTARQSIWINPTFAVLILMLLALFFNWAYLTGGFQGDEIIFLNLLEEDPLPFSRWRGIWSVNDFAFRLVMASPIYTILGAVSTSFRRPITDAGR